MAKITELLLQMKRYLDEFGDCQVVFKYTDNTIKDILSCGMSKAQNIKDEEVKVCWMAAEFMELKTDTDKSFASED